MTVSVIKGSSCEEKKIQQSFPFVIPMSDNHLLMIRYRFGSRDPNLTVKFLTSDQVIDHADRYGNTLKFVSRKCLPTTLHLSRTK